MSGGIIQCQKAKQRTFDTFHDAQRYVKLTGQGWDLEEIGAGIFIVTYGGQIVGKGLNWNVAVADAESNM